MASSGSVTAPASKAQLAEVLDWCFAAKIEATDAFACAKALLEAGVSDYRTRIRSLVEQPSDVLKATL